MDQPGTGKTTLARLIAEELFGVTTQSETATADWTSFETVGGLQVAVVDGRQELRPQAGVITSAIVASLNAVAQQQSVNADPQAVWLLLDELNRANMDAAFGELFTALDAAHRTVSLPFFDEPRRQLVVPKRFRIIGTMNSYDKNFLFRLSYALMRRFAQVSIDPPGTGANAEAVEARSDEQEKLWINLAGALADHGRNDTPGQLQQAWGGWPIDPLYTILVQEIRSGQRLARGVGFAQVAAAARQAALMVHLGLVNDDEDGHAKALDAGVRSSIVPQLEGLPNNLLADFVKWWGDQQPPVGAMPRSIEATRLLMRGTSLFAAT